MARFLTRSQLARVTPVLGHHYRSSLGLFSTTPNMKIPLFENPNKYLRTEEQNEKHRKVKQLAKEVVILSCESTANGGVCDVYVLGVTHNSPESCREVQAITSYLKPQLLFIELCKNRSFHSLPFEPKPNEYEVHFRPPRTSRDIIKDLMGKRIDVYKAYEEWSAARRFKKNPDELEAAKKRVMNSEFTVAYQEAIKYGIMVVLGDRPDETRLREDHLERDQRCKEMEARIAALESGVPSIKEALANLQLKLNENHEIPMKMLIASLGQKRQECKEMTETDGQQKATPEKEKELETEKNEAKTGNAPNV